MTKVQITKTAAEALNLLPNKDNEYFVDAHSQGITGQQLANVCAHYEMLLKTEKQKLSEVLGNATIYQMKKQGNL